AVLGIAVPTVEEQQLGLLAALDVRLHFSQNSDKNPFEIGQARRAIRAEVRVHLPGVFVGSNEQVALYSGVEQQLVRQNRVVIRKAQASRTVAFGVVVADDDGKLGDGRVGLCAGDARR